MDNHAACASKSCVYAARACLELLMLKKQDARYQEDVSHLASATSTWPSPLGPKNSTTCAPAPTSLQLNNVIEPQVKDKYDSI